MRQVDTIIFDFDNTLWDQVGAYESGLRGLIDEMSALTGASEQDILSGIIDIQRQYKIREHGDIFSQHPVLKNRFGDPVPAAICDRLQTFWAEHEQGQLNLYPGVRETLTHLKNKGFSLVLYSEADTDKLARRVKALGLDHYFERVYSAPPPAQWSQPAPKTLSLKRIQSQLAVPHKYITSSGPKKDAVGLGLILADLAKKPEQVLMIGDNAVRDVAMAQSIGAFGAHAHYGLPVKLPGNLYDQTGFGAYAARGSAEPEKKVEVKPNLVIAGAISRLPAMLDALGVKPANNKGMKP